MRFMVPPLGALMMNELLRGRRGLSCVRACVSTGGGFASEGGGAPIQHLRAGNVNNFWLRRMGVTAGDTVARARHHSCSKRVRRGKPGESECATAIAALVDKPNRFRGWQT